MDLFQEEMEQTAIERIQKFAKIAKTMGFEVRLGMSDKIFCYFRKFVYLCTILRQSMTYCSLIGGIFYAVLMLYLQDISR